MSRSRRFLIVRQQGAARRIDEERSRRLRSSLFHFLYASVRIVADQSVGELLGNGGRRDHHRGTRLPYLRLRPCVSLEEGTAVAKRAAQPIEDVPADLHRLI